ncbi:MAG: response regulator transcription factor [Clostridiaceae bacterium]|nr:response regulator transcription factor [Clostridiaceae bacterium]
MAKILVIEDDNDINNLVQAVLVKEGFEIISAFSGTEGALRLEMDKVDLIICDLMLPGLSGEEFIEKAREKYKMPIIALTAKGSLEDKVNVLGLGADDYVTKPFEPKELIARVKAQLRRIGMIEKETVDENMVLQFKDLTLDSASMIAKLNGQKLNLTFHEFQILEVMFKNPKKVFSKEALYEAVWKQGYYGEDNTISVHISNIRKKIQQITNEEYISTVWGIGFRLNF